MCEGGENCLKYLRRGWNRKEGKGNKDFEKGDKLGQGVGALKRGRGWNPLKNYGLLVAKARTLLEKISLWEIMFSILHVFYQMRQTIWMYSGILKVLYI